MFRCKNCLNASTRPRIIFNKDNICNACLWSEEKKNLNWNEREKKLIELVKTIKKKKTYSEFDCIVPVSGGKDGSYVAHNLKYKYGLNVLCVTVNPPMQLSLGKKNLEKFKKTGFDLISIDVEPNILRKIDKQGFIDDGQGYYGWMVLIHTAVIKLAQKFKIKYIFYSEDGEVEYGGSDEKKNKQFYNIDYMKKVYLNDKLEKILKKSNLEQSKLNWFTFDEKIKINFTHYSFYENWDPYRNYLYAKKHCGLEDLSEGNIGTFTNFAQNDQVLASFHYYLMYLKFGFGRATQDAGIEIRRGAMTRDQALNLVRLYDGVSPEVHFNEIAEYYEISIDNLWKIIKKHTNRTLFEINKNKIRPKFVIE
jgi:N-acetyl sugar amidotransferase